MKTKKVSSVSTAKSVSGGEGPTSSLDRILQAAESRFFRAGFTATTVDEIAADLGMSKATIYRLIPGKDWLIREVMARVRTRIMAGVDGIMAGPGDDFVERIVRLMAFLGARFAAFPRHVIDDLRRNLPEVWAEIESYRRDKILSHFKSVLGAGIEAGVFRSDINLDLMLLMYLAVIERLITPETIVRANVTATELFRSIVDVFFGGLLTPEGRRRFRDFKTPDFRPFPQEA